ncbi:helix-turn-helix transcriptional regulator [Thermoleophilia bacterium SCSIO 60948]|nr:helix-turn-helix transcriptional regulator [Thermoleophilia bacterium SCSIO 60948]
MQEHEPSGGGSLERPIRPVVAEAIADRLRVLGQPVRVRMLDRLDADGEQTVGALADALDERLHNISQHLAVLRSAGAVSRRHHGRQVFYRLSDPVAMPVYEHVAAGLRAESIRLNQLIDRRE